MRIRINFASVNAFVGREYGENADEGRRGGLEEKKVCLRKH